MKKLIIVLLMIAANTLYSQQKYTFENEGPYYPLLQEEYVVISQDTISGYWQDSIFYSQDGIHSYTFWYGTIEKHWNICLPPADKVFRLQKGLTYPASLWGFRISEAEKNRAGMYDNIILLGFGEPNENGMARLIVEVKLDDVRYDPISQRVTGFQNGTKVVITNPIDPTALK